MFRIGILVDSTIIQAWQAEAIKQLLATGLVEFSVLVVNQFPKTSAGQSPFLYRVYRKLDRIFFKNFQDAFEPIQLSGVIPIHVPILSIKPIQTKYRDSFSDEDIENIAQYDLDILIRFGFRILTGEILKLPKLGVWSFHHGDPIVYRGGPPAFWEVMRQIPVTGCVLMRINEKLDQGEVLYQTYTQTDPLSVQRNANRIFWLSASFPARVIQRINRSIGQASLKSPEMINSSPILRPPQAVEMTQLLAGLVYRNGKRKLKELVKRPHWDIAWLKDFSLTHQEVSKRNLSFPILPNLQDEYLADPFPIRFEGRDWVFVEQFDSRIKKGKISVLDQEGNLTPVLEEPWHLSYPFIWEEEGKFYLIPESADAGKLWLYQASYFPFKWERVQAFFPGEAFDPTLWKAEIGYWLFVNQKSHPACSPFDELHLYFSPTLIHPNWVAHPQNPIVSDVGRSRPAGALFEENGRLYRPAQDSAKRYGHRIRVMEIKELSLENYIEQESFHIEPAEGILGVHTLNRLGDRWIVDLHSRKCP